MLTSFKFPRRVYVETTTFCNGSCTFCPLGRTPNEDRIPKFMSFETFRKIADNLKKMGIKIRCLYNLGEPLSDKGLFEKYKYARELGVLDNIVGLNSNGHLLHENMYDDLLMYTRQISFSCPNTGDEYEKLTGLNWDDFFRKVTDFIKYRDANDKSYDVLISTNRVDGSNLINVFEAFRGYNVVFEGDPGVDWGDRWITGVRYCDINNGTALINIDGDITTCCFDFKGENKFGNVLKDSEDLLCENLNKNRFKLCRKCDYGNKKHIK